MSQSCPDQSTAWEGFLSGKQATGAESVLWSGGEAGVKWITEIAAFKTSFLPLICLLLAAAFPKVEILLPQALFTRRWQLRKDLTD